MAAVVWPSQETRRWNTSSPTFGKPVATEKLWITTPSDDATALIFVERPISFASQLPVSVTTGDVDGDGDLDLVGASFTDNGLFWYEGDAGTPPFFTPHFIPHVTRFPNFVAIADFDADLHVDVAVGYALEVGWYMQGGEICSAFDANGDGTINGTELAWLLRGFGLPVTDPATEWWAPMDYTADGVIDGDDLAVLGSFGVWGTTTATCAFSCR